MVRDRKQMPGEKRTGWGQLSWRGAREWMVLGEGCRKESLVSKNNLKWKKKGLWCHLDGVYCWMMEALPWRKLHGVWGLRDRVASVSGRWQVGPTGSLLIPGIYQLACALLCSTERQLPFQLVKAALSAFETLHLCIRIWPSRRGWVMPCYIILVPCCLRGSAGTVLAFPSKWPLAALSPAVMLLFLSWSQESGVRTGEVSPFVSMFRVAKNSLEWWLWLFPQLLAIGWGRSVYSLTSPCCKPSVQLSIGLLRPVGMCVGVVYRDDGDRFLTQWWWLISKQLRSNRSG